MKRLRSRSYVYSEQQEANPMDGLSNLADAMLVLAVGIMLALIINWKLDIDPAAASAEPADERIELSDDDITETNDNPDESALTQVGSLFYDEETGNFYVIQN